MAAPAANDAWAVGTRQVASGGLGTLAWEVGRGSTSPFGGTTVGIALRWNGTSWRSVPIPQPSPIMLFGVAALAADDVWAVGHTYLGGPHSIPLVLHWNRTAWSRATIPAFPSGGQLRDVVALSPTNVYAVGLDGGRLRRPNPGPALGRGLLDQTGHPSPPVGPKLYGAAAIGPSTVWGVGYRYDQRLAANQTLTIPTMSG